MNNNKSPLYFVALVLILIACAASIVLAGAKFALFTPPGCGEGSGCDTVTKGPWGTIPLLDWPVSFLGVAWFVGLFVGWLKRSTSSKLFIWAVRLGVLMSLGFVFLMIFEGTFCKWCLLAHIGNFLFWVVAEFLHRKNIVGSFVAFIVTFFVTTGLLVAGWNIMPTFGETVTETTARFLEADHRIGSPDAPIQVVMFTDYQCPDCKRIESQLATIMRQRDDVSVSIKHFPLCFDCNDNIGQFKLHANACWAARAAETASVLGGEEAWEIMHTWLFSQGGSFTDVSFPPVLKSMGFDPHVFVEMMKSPEMLQRVKDSADDGFALGVYFTPMVFINGKEYLWYYGTDVSLPNIIEALSVELKNGESNAVVPPDAKEKLIEDWRRGTKRQMPGHERLSWVGDGDIEFIVWGDYQTNLTGVLEGFIRDIMKNNPNVKYAFRHFPVDDECNPHVASMPTKYDGSCFLAKLVEAVSLLSSEQARWDMHQWILRQKSRPRQSDALQAAANFSGMDVAIIQNAMSGMEVQNRLQVDLLTKNSVWRRSIPVLTIDGRFVPRWRSSDVTADKVFQRILEVVASERESGTSR